MYDYLKGILSQVTANYIVVEVAGIGYRINVANPYSFSEQLHQELQVYLYHLVREDAQLLYGFHTEAEKAVFLNLISVSGIGPTSALAIIAVDDNEGLVRAIDNNDVTYLTKFPKIGKKTAQQMVLDLAGKFTDSKEIAVKKTQISIKENTALEEAMEAMLALGYKAAELRKIKKFFEGTTDTAENYIKSSLKMLMK
ncbi:Holliday junction branch migration protein RuvA [Streptococcus macacae]|uniref:Holliday junction branch migration complex subunit RuvA n=1 Tax=Streptococcus macacae NCTC 11558 TaxID=764298 RepID=G5JWZ6_9STRE|nr:Holliday junction branch migration protein RuvA [Streptococcus macacae]EHJ52466.1 Holliday junction DNA helicase RuvA [Streptococcus macacae NCTC 11558]SUN79472.1 Holliday junction DNA helicase [Streptococcus macacae NCTC 11558]